MNVQSSTQCAWQLSALLKGWVDVDSQNDVLVTGVSQHSGETLRGDLFLATAGENSHGLQYCADAISKGAAAIAWEPVTKEKSAVPICSVPAIEFQHLSKHVGDITSRCYGDVTAQVEAIAITGTDGKSSVAHMTAQALENLTEPCGLIGTLGYGLLSNLADATHTTPPVTRIAKELVNIVREGCKYVAMEASSHGLAQNRLQNLNIHTAVLTNITRDHLDYHQSIDSYMQAKAKLFFSHQPSNAVLSYDDTIGRQWIEALQPSTNVLSYSLNNADADVYASNIEFSESGTALDLHIKSALFRLQTPLLGGFNVLNILAVVAVLLSLSKSLNDIVNAVQRIQPVPGRMQVIRARNGPVAVIDFAHTPAALLAAINAVRQHFSGKLVCVFGCGGDRDVGKRPEMGAIVTSNADYTVITSDNPRTEHPRHIIEQIVEGCDVAANYKIIIDRKQAIAHALEVASDQDVVLIAGKGHEKYQQVGENKIVFDDVEIAMAMLN